MPMRSGLAPTPANLLKVLAVVVLGGIALMGFWTTRTEPIAMRVVDDTDGRPIAAARAYYCGFAWKGTWTGHGGAREALFSLEAATDRDGNLRFAPAEFKRWPYGLNTNYDHAEMEIVAAGYQSMALTNCCNALGSFAAAVDWGYNGSTIRLKRAQDPRAPSRPRGQCR